MTALSACSGSGASTVPGTLAAQSAGTAAQARSAAAAAVYTAGTPIDLSAWNSSLWIKSDGWSDGSGFNVGWRADHAVGVNGSQLALTIDTDKGACPKACSGKPYAAGELQSSSTYGYGVYQMDMKASNASGTVSAIFTYIDPTQNGTNDEIDVEIPGARTTTLETTYYRHGGAGVEHTINLSFDASAAFHTYGIQWLPNSISWIVDGNTLYTAAGSPTTLPTVPPYFMLNFWTGVPSWLGPFKYAGPVQALYQNPKFIPACATVLCTGASPAPSSSPVPGSSSTPIATLSPAPAPTVLPTVKPTAAPTATPAPTAKPTIAPTATPAPTPVPTVDLSAWNSTLWIKSDGWSDGTGFNLGWRADHAVGVNGSQLALTIDTDNGACPAACSGKPYAGGELQSASTYGFGTYQVDMKTSNASGTVSTFFTYIDPTQNGTNDEIDVEIPGARSTTLEATYYRHGGAGVEHTINLGFDSSAAFHAYGIRWLANSISWIVDGQVLYTAAGSPATLPTVPPYFMINFWTGVPSWLGPFNYAGPVQALYQNPKFIPAS